jgi:CDP-glycerol glycerophosphotransferase (TagB/SpsB family)
MLKSSMIHRKINSIYLAAKDHFIQSDIHFYCYSIFDEIYVRSTVAEAINSGLEVTLSISIIQDSQINELYNRYVGIKKIFRHHKFFLPNIKRFKIVVTPSTNINRRNIGISKLSLLAHMPHSLASITGIYTEDAFDSFDLFLAATNYQANEYYEICQKRNLNGKSFLVGYGKFDVMFPKLKEVIYNKENKKCILIAPSWTNTELINDLGHELIKNLLMQGFQVVLRPHPSQIPNIGFESSNKLLNLANEENSFIIENPHHIQHQSIYQADLLITDYSGISFEFFFLTKRPVLFIDLPKKILNQKLSIYNQDPVEIRMRERIGLIVRPKIDEIIPSIIQLLSNTVYNLNVDLNEEFIHSDEIKVSERASKVLNNFLEK